ncbi:GMC oxidoreductase [Streptomyces coerulescens]|uniref:GMC oxidoreductase n=1 Tax=Streptomyces coerulescens TaxID=29304 RepID=A0ABW0CXJ9_STRCD
MGAPDDPMAFCDPELRVRGGEGGRIVEGVRIVEASVSPAMPTINPMVTVPLAAERAADLITAGPEARP